jgi:hypothetical protein
MHKVIGRRRMHVMKSDRRQFKEIEDNTEELRGHKDYRPLL